MYFAPVTAADVATRTVDPSKLAVQPTDLIDMANDCPWFDGITVYVHSVDAEKRVTNAITKFPIRIDSGVRLINGRGPIASLDGTIYKACTGFTFATNDAAYILGHFNADGTINSNAADKTAFGGYSAVYPDSKNEKLCAIMADAITILSQPSFTDLGGGVYAQSTGWSDSLSGHRRDIGTSPQTLWSASWNTTNPSSTNRSDGVNTSLKPTRMPMWSNAVTPAGNVGFGAATTFKFPATTTEISCCFLTGVIPTNHNPAANAVTGAKALTDGPPSPGPNGQFSGGAHNYPRLLEIWTVIATGVSAGLYIRGSFVAMYESRVAMEPWSLRNYNAPGRFWGLHDSLSGTNLGAHDIPLEPKVIGARRMSYRELSADEFKAKSDEIAAYK
jgi:hypothetical protein